MSNITKQVSNYEPIKGAIDDLTSLCRACLQKQDNMKFLPLDLKDTNLILKRLSFLLSTEITLAEKTPMYVCKICEEHINKSYAFKSQVIESNKYIENWLNLKSTADTILSKDSSKITKKGVDIQILDESDLMEHQCSSCNTTFKTFKHAYSEGGSILLCHLCKFQMLGVGLESDKEEILKIEYTDDPLQVDYEDFKEEQHLPQQKPRLKKYNAELIRDAIDKVKQKHYKHVTCKLCKFTAVENRSLSVHMGRVHSEIKSSWCPICNETFEDLEQHHKDVHSEDLKCPFCGKHRKNMGKFVEHMAYHSETRLFQCRLCGNSYNFLRQLKKHQINHHNDQSWLVPKNDGEPENESVNKAATKVKHLCPHCGKQFMANHKLVIHMRSHTGDAPYQCNLCEKRFNVRAHLVVHERTHTGERPHKCIYCDKTFVQSSTLNTHLKIHTGKTIKCKMCDKTFCRPGAMMVHMREHTGEKPYVCKTCGQTFKQKSHLVEHSRKHSDDRPFECSYCGRSFKNLYTMKVHEQIHTGDKPFQCSQCSYACRQTYSLTQHMKQHENDQPQRHSPHVCEVCQKAYTTLAHLFTHIRRFHPNMIDTETPQEADSDPDEPEEEEIVKIEVLENAGLEEGDQVDDSVLEFMVLH